MRLNQTIANLAFLLLLHAPALAADEDKILQVVSDSSCLSYDWPGRGVAPPGYIKGVSLVYAKNYCELARGEKNATFVMSGKAGPASSDALTLYDEGDGTSRDRLRATYTLAIGLGMRESSGNTTEGRDTTVKHPTAQNAEAGLFQTSYDSLGKDPSLRKLWDYYRTHQQACHLNVFREGVKDKKIDVFGSGEPADYQTMTKECPAFATEYVMVMLRVDRHHFGPINTRKAEYHHACNSMLRQIEAKLDCSP
ncbi:MAG: hypothetical protein QOC72_3569 [Methylobacteriaceae bacterium]|jgi:hypothetical protein|nr:hypothetical protein [Methylobacteriaceae bacterium]